ncbi:hypothetical protein [Kitasatospora sp. KL5]|uniref:hypothetical protein n=1 Tax=Kitasatospora sp. KL5 TaxID=3425125 RepID=UPI003D6DF008
MSGIRSEQELVVGLAALAESAAPPSTVDAGAAVRRGRDRVARRRMSVWGAAAAVLLVCSSVVAGVGGRSAAPVGPAGPGRPSPGVGAPGGEEDPAADGVPLLSAQMEFGWLPESVHAVRYSYGANGYLVQASGDAEGGGIRFALSVYPVGVVPPPERRSDGTEVKVAAPPVNGQVAYWTSAESAADDTTVLRWLTVDGRWAEVVSSSVPEGQRETLTHKVAEKALFGPMKVQLPVRLSGAPAVYALVGADLLRPVSGAGGWTLRLTFSVSPTQSFSTTAVPVGSNWLRSSPRRCRRASARR